MSTPTHFDISAQQQTYAAFIKGSMMGSVAIVIFLISGALFLV